MRLLPFLLSFFLLPVASQSAPLGPLETEIENLIVQYADKSEEENLRATLALGERAKQASYSDQLSYWLMLCYNTTALKKLDDARTEQETLLTLATARKDDAGLSAAALCAAKIALAEGNTGKAFELSGQAFEYARKVADNPILHFRVGNSYGDIALAKEHMDLAMDGYRMALQGAENVDDKRREATTLFSIATVYSYMSEYEQALAVLDRALALVNQLGLRSLAANIELSRGSVLTSLNKIEDARRAYLFARDIGRELHNASLEIGANLNLSDNFLHQHNYLEAEKIATEVKNQAAAIDDRSTVAIAEANIGFAMAGQKHIDLAYGHVRSALDYFRKQDDLRDMAGIQEEWAAALASNGRYAEALDAYREHQKLSNTLLSRDREKAVLQLQQEMETNKKEKEIQLLNKENALQSADIRNRELQQHLWWVLAMLFTALFGVVLLLYKRVRESNLRLAEKNKELDFQSTRDPLTSLYNRRYFQQIISEVDISQPDRRTAAHPDMVLRALYLIDIDHFKRINDKHGHAAGDAALVDAADRLREGLRDHDVIVRWGGEEFLIFAQQLPLPMVQPLAQRILELFAQAPVQYDDKLIRMTASVGYCLLPLRGPNDSTLGWERTLNIIDMALYLAKAHGRNRAYGVTALASEREDVLEQIERDLEEAWESGLVELQRTVGPGDAA